jgi:hypothetical protein
MICPQCGFKLTLKKLKAGSTYALEVDEWFTEDMRQRLLKHLSTLDLGVKILVVESGLHLKERKP